MPAVGVTGGPGESEISSDDDDEVKCGVLATVGYDGGGVLRLTEGSSPVALVQSLHKPTSGLLGLGLAIPTSRAGTRYLIVTSMLAPSAAKVMSGGGGVGSVFGMVLQVNGKTVFYLGGSVDSRLVLIGVLVESLCRKSGLTPASRSWSLSLLR